MNATDFAEATGYLRAVEKRILTTQNLDRVLDTPSPEEALRMLSQSGEIDFSAAERPDDYEIVLKGELKRVYDLLYGICPAPELVDILSAKYDFHNVKVAVKATALKEDHEPLFISVTEISPKAILSLAGGTDTMELPEYLIEAVIAARQAFEDMKDPQMVDILVDKLMFAHMLLLCEKLDNAFITEYVRTQIDFYNAKTTLRVKNMDKGLKFLQDALIPGGIADTDAFSGAYDRPVESVGDSFTYSYFSGIMQQTVEGFEKSGDFSAMEKLTDNYLINYIKSAKLVAFGPEPLFAYIVAKENEIKQIRILMTCKANNIPADILKERLRDNYA